MAGRPAVRPSEVTLLYYFYTIISNLEMFSFPSSPTAMSIRVVSPVCGLNLPGRFTAYVSILLAPMLPGLQQWRRAYARSVICESQGILCTCLRWWSKECGTTSYPKRPSLDSSCGVPKEAESSETDTAHVTSPNWCRFSKAHTLLSESRTAVAERGAVSADTSGRLT